jgi:hypothetical protein
MIIHNDNWFKQINQHHVFTYIGIISLTGEQLITPPSFLPLKGEGTPTDGGKLHATRSFVVKHSGGLQSSSLASN